MRSINAVLAAAVAIGALGGCVMLDNSVVEPNVAARFTSDKTAGEFARCASAQLSDQFKLDSAGTAYSLTRRQGITINARWDFHPTNSGSEAELRSDSDDGAGIETVRACA